MKLSKAVFWLICVLVVLLLSSFMVSGSFLNQTALLQITTICLVNFGISLCYIFIHTYFYNIKPYAFGFIAMITLTIKFVLAYVLLKPIDNVIYAHLFLRATYFIVFAIFMIIDVLYAVLLLNSTKK